MTKKRLTPQTRSNTAGRVKVSYRRDNFFRDPKKHESDSQWDRFEGFVKKIAAVPKEEVDELRAVREREKKES